MDAAQQLAIALQRFLNEQPPQPVLQPQLQPQKSEAPTKTPQVYEAEAAGRARAEAEQRRYHMGAKPTPGLNYDDRLTVRLGMSATTVYKYLGLPEHRGGIRHRRMGKKYYVT